MTWAREELVRQIAIPSCSGDEAAMIDYLESRSAELGLPTRRQRVSPRQDNLVIGCTESPQLALVAHVDTARPAWEPQEVDVRDREVRGLGAVDDKGGIVACLLGWLLAEQEGVSVSGLAACACFVVDEEVGGTGSLELAKWLKPRYAVVLEGTGLDIAIAEAGHLDARMTVRGRSAHTGTFEQADSALEKAARMVAELGLLPLSANVDPLIGRSAVHAISFHSGSPGLNAIPEVAELYLVARIGRGLRVQEVFDQLRELAKRFDAELDKVAAPTPGQWECSEPVAVPGDSPIVRVLQRLVQEHTGRESRLCGCPCWTDAHNLIEHGGTQAAVFGPGRISRAHGPNEHIDVAEIVTCAEVFKDVLAAVQAGEIR